MGYKNYGVTSFDHYIPINTLWFQTWGLENPSERANGGFDREQLISELNSGHFPASHVADDTGGYSNILVG